MFNSGYSAKKIGWLVNFMSSKLPKELLLKMFSKMSVTREFEESVMRNFSKGKIHGTCHMCVGEEATHTGTMFARKDNDYVFGTHRGHGQGLAFGLETNRMMAEIFGKETGYCKGKGGSMHIASPAEGYLGSNGIVGGNLPLSTGTGLAVKLKKMKDTVVFSYFGDGATNEGSFHESLNMASLWKLPVIYVCVNNTYGMSTHITRSMGDTDFKKRAKAYGMPYIEVDGNNVIEVYEATVKAREVAANEGPILLICNTYRTLGHSKSDANRYRTKEEIESWKQRCPIKQLREYLVKEKIATEKELDTLYDAAIKEVEDAVEFAENSDFPALTEVLSDVFAD